MHNTPEFDKLDALRHYGMRCPACSGGMCVVVNLSRKYAPMLSKVHEELLLPKTELGILNALHTENGTKTSSFCGRRA